MNIRHSNKLDQIRRFENLRCRDSTVLSKRGWISEKIPSGTVKNQLHFLKCTRTLNIWGLIAHTSKTYEDISLKLKCRTGTKHDVYFVEAWFWFRKAASIDWLIWVASGRKHLKIFNIWKIRKCEWKWMETRRQSWNHWRMEHYAILTDEPNSRAPMKRKPAGKRTMKRIDLSV